jgi:sterol desaturase/sphingolipid hydroxylase (fatty acid hydroxylase superfamily)
MPSDLLSTLKSFIQTSSLVYILAVFSVFLLLEKWFYAERNQSLRGVLFNIRYTVLYLVMAAVLQPVIGFVTSLAIASAGGGWISLPRWFGEGALNAIFRTVTYLFIFDFFYYWFHRFQHAVPVLWSQHKLHHSDMEVNVTTTHRHHWLEEPLRMVFILIPMGIVFQVQPVTGGIIGMVFGLWGFFIHSNLRLNLYSLTPLFGGPHVHRVHHSILPEHANRNFAAFFPFFDVLFGTFIWPKSSEFPATGLHSRETVSTIFAASCWPFREWGTGRFLEGTDRFSPVGFANIVILVLTPVIFLAGGTLYFARNTQWVTALEVPRYRLGETIEFRRNTAAVEYLQRGWSSPEQQHTWMDGSIAEINIPVTRIPSRMRVSFLVRAFVEPQKLPKQRYRVSLNGDKLVESEIASGEPVRIEVDVDKPHLDRTLRFTMEAPDAAAPKDLGISSDERHLGLALLNLRVAAIE